MTILAPREVPPTERFDEPSEFELEQEEERSNENRDVLTREEPRVLPDEEFIPRGMESAVGRDEDGKKMEEPGEDLETGEN